MTYDILDKDINYHDFLEHNIYGLYTENIYSFLNGYNYKFWKPTFTGDLETEKPYPLVKSIKLDNGENVLTMSNLIIHDAPTRKTIEVIPLGLINDEYSVNTALRYMTNTIAMYPDDTYITDDNYVIYNDSMYAWLTNTYNYAVDLVNDSVATYYDVKERAIRFWDDTIISALYDQTNLHYHGANLRDKSMQPVEVPTTQYFTLSPKPYDGYIHDVLYKILPLAYEHKRKTYEGQSIYNLLSLDPNSKTIIDNMLAEAQTLLPSYFANYRDFFEVILEMSYRGPSTYYIYPYRIHIRLFNVDQNKFKMLSSQTDEDTVYAFHTSQVTQITINNYGLGLTAYGYVGPATTKDYNFAIGSIHYHNIFSGYYRYVDKDGLSNNTNNGDYGTFSGFWNNSASPDWVTNNYAPTGRTYSVDYPDNPKELINDNVLTNDTPPDNVPPKDPDTPTPTPSPKQIRDRWKIPVPVPDRRIPSGSIEPPSPQSTLGLFTVYYLNDQESQLAALKNKLWNPDAISVIKEMFSDNPINSIVDLHALYAQPTEANYGDEKNIYLYTVDCGDASSSPVITNNVITLSYGYKEIPRKYYDYRDFTPYTNIDLYLPFIGFEHLPVDPFMGDSGGSIGVQYNVDIVTGNCVAFVMSSVNNIVQCVATYEGNCSYQLPIYGVDRTQLGRNALGAVGDLFSGNFGGATSKVLSTNQSIMKSGSISGNHGSLSYKQPFFIINRCVDADTDYADIQGYTTNNRGTLGSFSGYTRVVDCHVDTIGCTQEEQTMIYNMLKSGIII